MGKSAMERYRDRRAYSIIKLGGKCVSCGSTENLEFDHKEKSKKSFNITQFWSISKERYDEELAKCQLLCHDCHVAKSFREHDWGKGYGATGHGTSTFYKNYGCRCAECKKAYNKVTREQRQLARLNRILDE